MVGILTALTPAEQASLALHEEQARLEEAEAVAKFLHEADIEATQRRQLDASTKPWGNR